MTYRCEEDEDTVKTDDWQRAPCMYLCEEEGCVGECGCIKRHTRSNGH